MKTPDFQKLTWIDRTYLKKFVEAANPDTYLSETTNREAVNDAFRNAGWARPEQTPTWALKFSAKVLLWCCKVLREAGL